ncbi:MAG: hypothetical protein WAT39_18660, partial [Planctomycetota bacterium]
MSSAGKIVVPSLLLMAIGGGAWWVMHGDVAPPVASVPPPAAPQAPVTAKAEPATAPIVPDPPRT